MLRKVTTNQTKTTLLLFLVFAAVIFLFSGLVYFSIVNFSNQRFFELLKVRATTIIQIETSIDSEDLNKEIAIYNGKNDED